MFQRLLVCTDFSDGLHRLVHFIPSLAAAQVKHVTFMHSVPFREIGGVPKLDEEKINQARQKLSPGLKHEVDGIEVDITIESGRLLDDIYRLVAERNLDLVLTGMTPRDALSERLFGSTTKSLCRNSSVPILIFRPQLLTTYTSEELSLRCRHMFRHLMVPYDGQTASKYCVEAIKQRVQHQPDSALKECHLCWVVSDGGRRELPIAQKLTAADQELTAVKADLEALNIKTTALVLQGDAVTQIIEASMEPDIQAIAISSDTLGKLAELAVPSFAVELISKSWHPVLFFPNTR
jgi:nucleotide-binding universal stress UspA family protein